MQIRRRWFALFAVLVLWLTLSWAYAQKAASGQRKTLTVTVQSLLPGGAMLAPVEGDLAPFAAFITAKTRFHRPSATAGGFVSGERVVVRAEFPRTGPTGRVLVHEVWDVGIYEEQSRLRREICLGRVAQGLPPGASSGHLTVTREEGGTVTFRVTEKTRFCRGDMTVAPAAYQAGDAVAVKPRALPGGGVMAAVVAETSALAERAYRDSLTVWRGRVEIVAPTDLCLWLQREDGARRMVILPRDMTVTDEKMADKPPPKKLYYLAELKDKTVKINLVRGERPSPIGARSATRISVTSASPASALPAAAEVAGDEE